MSPAPCRDDRIVRTEEDASRGSIREPSECLLPYSSCGPPPLIPFEIKSQVDRLRAPDCHKRGGDHLQKLNKRI